MIIIPSLRGSLFSVQSSGVSTPPDMEYLSMWFKASSGVTTSSLIPSDGDLIDRWANQSTVGSTHALATGTGRPTYKTNIINGYPVIRFNGSSNFMALSSSVDNNYTASFMFWMVANIASDVNYNMLLTKMNNPYSPQYEYRLGPKPANFTSVRWTGDAVVNTTLISTSSWYRYALRKTPDRLDGDAYIYVNNANMNFRLGENCNPTTDPVYLGKRMDNFGYLNGDIAEWGFYITASVDILNRLDTYITTKYGLV